MSCNTCQSKFTFFTRENGCPNCGFSYCGKCLKYNWLLTANGSEKRKKICGPCYNKLTIMTSKGASGEDDSSKFPAETTSERKLAPVDITNKLESLENPAKPPIVIYKAGDKGRWENFKVGLEPADQIIVDRLEKLKDSDGRSVTPPTTEEIRRRLAILKDQNPETRPRSCDIHQTDTRSDREKEDDLIRRYLENFELTRGNDDPIKEIEERLNSLRDHDPRIKYSGASRELDEDDDDEKATERIIEKAIAEAAIEAKYGSEELEFSKSEQIEGKTTSNADADDEDVSCCMCEQTVGLVSCEGCTGDLYCEICFDDNHDEAELPRHKTVSREKCSRTND